MGSAIATLKSKFPRLIHVSTIGETTKNVGRKKTPTVFTKMMVEFFQYRFFVDANSTELTVDKLESMYAKMSMIADKFAESCKNEDGIAIIPTTSILKKRVDYYLNQNGIDNIPFEKILL